MLKKILLKKIDESEQKKEIPQGKFLTQTKAEARSQLVKEHSVIYRLFLGLRQGEKFSGIVDLDFELQNFTNQSDVFLDFAGKNVDEIEINGVHISDTTNLWDKLFLTLPNQHLKNGFNNVVVRFSNEYVQNGHGLHSFIDTDQKQYLYSQGQPYYMNKIFPNFDQPDIKGKLDLRIVGPQDWVILSNESFLTKRNFSLNIFEATITRRIPNLKTIVNDATPDQDQIIVFARTQYLPSYLFAIVAGPYKELSCDKPHRNMPMNLFCRESLFEHLQRLAPFIFEVTNRSMEIFQKFFHYPYPFSKYDQIFCAEFNSGAMENAGCVTFNDKLLWREQVDANKMALLANVISHELSHHWFGNLTTMKWWNDLWLNESFADFIAYFCMSKMKLTTANLPDAWVIFNMRKGWGIATDQKITTHPIAGNVQNTEAATTIFDGITYSKGAATLRQLLSLLGESDFSEAVGIFFNKFAFRNTQLQDFIDCLDEVFSRQNLGFNLKQWKEEWICTAGMNEITPVFNPNDVSRNAKLIIEQGPFFQDNAEYDVKEVLVDAKSQTVVEYDGSENYKAVLLNHEDLSFVKPLVDKYSREFFENNLHRIDNVLVRTLVYRAFYDLVRDAKISVQQYVNFFIKVIPNEKSEDIIGNQFLFLGVSLANFIPKKFLEEQSDQIFAFAVQFLSNVGRKSKNLELVIKSSLANFIEKDDQIIKMLDWYDNKNESLKGIEMGLQLEWQVIGLLARSSGLSQKIKDQYFQKQSEKDKTDKQKEMEIYCHSACVDESERKNLWNSFFDTKSEISTQLLGQQMAGFNNSKKINELEKYIDLWIQQLIPSYEKSVEFGNCVFLNLFPKTDNLDSLIAKLNKFLPQIPQQLPTLELKTKESIDDLTRRSKAYQLFN